MDTKEKEKIKNVIDYLYGMERDIEIFLNEHGKRSKKSIDEYEEFHRLSNNLLARIKYQLEQAQNMLKRVIGDEDGKE